MSASPKNRLTAEEFLAWSERREGRYELIDGEVVAQAAERVAHARRKHAVCKALESAIRSAGAPCEAISDGVAVRVDSSTVYAPDAQLHCGEKLPPDALLVEPTVVVEVRSPSTGKNDALGKLGGYFQLASIEHYLIVDPDAPLVIHHQRSEGDAILTRIHRDGVLRLDPPGLTLDLAEIYGAAIPDEAARRI